MNRLLKEYLFSPRAVCLGCGSVLGADKGFLCADCYVKINPLFVNNMSIGMICKNCGEEYIAGICQGCGKRKVSTLKAAAAYEYDEVTRNLVHTFKFRGAWRMSAWMAEEMLKASDDEFLLGAQAVVPVPMHITRRLVRGYNQSEKLAKSFSNLAKIDYLPALKRVRNTISQVSLRGDERRQNLKGAFEAVSNVSGKTIILIDDVRTTGTTAAECAKALYAAGAAEVRVLTFAKTLKR